MAGIMGDERRKESCPERMTTASTNKADTLTVIMHECLPLRHHPLQVMDGPWADVTRDLLGFTGWRLTAETTLSAGDRALAH